VCEQAFNWPQQHPIHSVVVSDRAAVAACERFISDHRLVVEPACGAALAAVYEQIKEIEPYPSILVIVCGGVTASIEQLHQWAQRLDAEIGS
jgi:L-serine/L-threonine ammonia-lyase